MIAVHYSCGLFGNGGEPAAIGCIVAKRLSDDSVTVFDARDGGEAAALDRFYQYALAASPDDLWVHWNMRDQQFGFEALARRARALGSPAVEVPASARVDLKRLFSEIYGENYVGHPRLPSLIHLNGITERGLLDEQKAASAFASRNWEALQASALRKVHAIDELFRRAAEGRLKTLAASGEPAAQSGNSPPRPPRKQRSTHGRGSTPKKTGDPLPPLTGKPKMVYDILKKLPKGEGLTGKQLKQKMPPGESLEPSTLTRHIIPVLRRHGVTNSPGVGYHIERPHNERGAGMARK